MIVLLDGIYFLVGSVFWKHEKRIFLERVVGRHIFLVGSWFWKHSRKTDSGKVPKFARLNSRKIPGSFRKLSV